MAGLRRLRGITSVKTLASRRRNRIKYSDFTTARPVSAPALAGSKDTAVNLGSEKAALKGKKQNG
jgi:hypothetical protein